MYVQHVLIIFGFAAMVVGAPRVASGQIETVRSTIDSAAALNRAGRWNAVAPVTRPAMARAIPEERCELLVQTLYAGAKLWRVTEVAQLLRSFDAQCAHAPVVASQTEALTQIRRTMDMPPMPSAGVDWSAVDEFWMVVDTLMAGIEPSSAQWHGLVSSPGYQIAMLSHPDLPRLIDIAFSPRRRAERDSSLAHASQDSVVITHVLKVAAARRELARFRAAIGPVMADTIAAAIKQSARYLPAGATDGRSPPFIAITVFADDGYSQQPGIVLDLYHIRDDGLTNFLAHEFNHTFSRSFDRTRAPEGAHDSRLFAAIRSLRNEGIADMVDKPMPLHMPADEQWYVTLYTAAYDASPTKLRTLDSLMVASTAPIPRAWLRSARVPSSFCPTARIRMAPIWRAQSSRRSVATLWLLPRRARSRSFDCSARRRQSAGILPPSLLPAWPRSMQWSDATPRLLRPVDRMIAQT